MVTTVGPASPDLWDAPWATDSVRRAYETLTEAPEPTEQPDEPNRPASVRRKNRPAALVAIREATGAQVPLDD